MKNTFLTFLFLFTFINTIFCQADSVQQVINADVWKPFMETYSALDTEGFMAIHTKDIIRINRNAKNIRIGEEYAKSQSESNKRSKERKSSRTIEFSFTERFASRQSVNITDRFDNFVFRVIVALGNAVVQ